MRFAFAYLLIVILAATTHVQAQEGESILRLPREKAPASDFASKGIRLICPFAASDGQLSSAALALR